MQLEAVVLYLEIGSKFLKALVFKTTWRKVQKIIYEKSKLSEGITINGIEDFPLFSQSLKKFIYEIEYEISEKIQDVIVIYGGLLSTHTTNVSKISIRNVVREADIQKYKNSTVNNPSYEVVHYNYFFIVDHFLYMTNPVGMECTHLVVKQNYLLLYKTIYQNLTVFFEQNDFSLKNIFFGPYVLAEYIRQYTSSFIIIDLGYYNCRVCFVENNIMREFHIINQGICHLVEKIAIKYRLDKMQVEEIIKSVDLLDSSNEVNIEVQNFLINLLNKCINSLNSAVVNTYDLQVFLNGFNYFYPIEYFVKVKMNRDFCKIASYFQWKENYEYLYAIHYLCNKK